MGALALNRSRLNLRPSSLFAVVSFLSYFGWTALIVRLIQNTGESKLLDLPFVYYPLCFQVQSLTSYIVLGVVMSASIPSIFVAVFMGSWTDQVGRKPALMAPIVGTLFESMIVLLIMYFKWPIYVLFIGSAVNGFCGFFTTIVLAVMSYIADTTDESERGLRLGIKISLIYNNFQLCILFLCAPIAHGSGMVSIPV